MSSEQNQARAIAERVAQRVGGPKSVPSAQKTGRPAKNGARASDELAAIRAGLRDLERKLERVESKMVQPGQAGEQPSRARLIDFVSSSPPLPVAPSIAVSTPLVSIAASSETRSEFVPPTQSPWLASMSSMFTSPSTGEHNPQSAIRNPQSAVSHPSQERFGVEEATVSEIVEFFESQKKCALEPGGKPCDHCAMCSSRGF